MPEWGDPDLIVLVIYSKAINTFTSNNTTNGPDLMVYRACEDAGS